MQPKRLFGFPTLDTVMNAAVLCAIATLLVLTAFSTDVLSVLA